MRGAVAYLVACRRWQEVTEERTIMVEAAGRGGVEVVKSMLEACQGAESESTTEQEWVRKRRRMVRYRRLVDGLGEGTDEGLQTPMIAAAGKGQVSVVSRRFERC